MGEEAKISVNQQPKHNESRLKMISNPCFTDLAEGNDSKHSEFVYQITSPVVSICMYSAAERRERT